MGQLRCVGQVAGRRELGVVYSSSERTRSLTGSLLNTAWCKLFKWTSGLAKMCTRICWITYLDLSYLTIIFVLLLVSRNFLLLCTSEPPVWQRNHVQCPEPTPHLHSLWLLWDLQNDPKPCLMRPEKCMCGENSVLKTPSVCQRFPGQSIESEKNKNGPLLHFYIP